MVATDAFPFPVDAGNTEQAGDWDGADGEYWATYHHAFERLLGVFDAVLLEAADVRAGDRCLDVGCGTGSTSLALAGRATAGSVVGLDLSGPMLAVARAAAAAAGHRHVEFVQADAQVHAFESASFDVAVSRMGCMFFGDPAAAYAAIGRALRPGGRLAFLAWQAEAANGWVTDIDRALGEDPSADDDEGYAPGPFSLADRDLALSLLEGAGLEDVRVDPLALALPFGSVDEATAFLETWIDEDLADDARAEASASLRRMLTEHETADGVLLPSATWLLTGRRPG